MHAYARAASCIRLTPRTCQHLLGGAQGGIGGRGVLGDLLQDLTGHALHAGPPGAQQGHLPEGAHAADHARVPPAGRPPPVPRSWPLQRPPAAQVHTHRLSLSCLAAVCAAQPCSQHRWKSTR